jgi:hypothetical protein
LIRVPQSEALRLASSGATVIHVPAEHQQQQQQQQQQHHQQQQLHRQHNIQPNITIESQVRQTQVILFDPDIT